eukprot:s225_g50.t1
MKTFSYVRKKELVPLCKDTAFYPSQVPWMLEGCEAWKTLLSLLEDESPQLQWLATRCLADLVGSGPESLRLQVREEVVRRGYLVRALLEGDDLDLTEAGFPSAFKDL